MPKKNDRGTMSGGINERLRLRLAGLSLSEDSGENFARTTTRETPTSTMEVELVWQHDANWDKFLVKYEGYPLGAGIWRTFDDLKMACPEALYKYMICPGMLRPERPNEAAHIKMLRTLQKPCPMAKREEVKAYIDYISGVCASSDEEGEMLHGQQSVLECTSCGSQYRVS